MLARLPSAQPDIRSPCRDTSARTQSGPCARSHAAPTRSPCAARTSGRRRSRRSHDGADRCRCPPGGRPAHHGGTPYPQVLVRRPRPQHRRQLVGEGGEGRPYEVLRGLVDHVPPRAGDDEVPEERHRLRRQPRPRPAVPGHRYRGVPLLAMGRPVPQHPDVALHATRSSGRYAADNGRSSALSSGRCSRGRAAPTSCSAAAGLPSPDRRPPRSVARTAVTRSRSPSGGWRMWGG